MTSLLFNLDFASNTISSSFFIFFLIIDLCFLIPAVIVQIFDPIAELLLETKKGNVEMEARPVIVKPKIRNFSI